MSQAAHKRVRRIPLNDRGREKGAFRALFVPFLNSDLLRHRTNKFPQDRLPPDWSYVSSCTAVALQK
jgi:hypothetical protein